jgi:hypothetical protein
MDKRNTENPQGLSTTTFTTRFGWARGKAIMK